MMHCRDFSLGYVFYECPQCDNFHISGLSCHSRFCVSCGTQYRERLIDKDLKMKHLDYFHFVSLRQSFMNQLLKRMYHYLKDHVNKRELSNFSKLRNALYKTYKKNFYANKSKKSFPGHYKLHTITSIQKASKRLRWRFSLIRTYHYDPLLCECGHIMKINYDLSYFPNTHIGGD